jgi:hypothetical protein
VQRIANRDMYRIHTPVKPDMIKSGLVSPDLVRPQTRINLKDTKMTGLRTQNVLYSESSDISPCVALIKSFIPDVSSYVFTNNNNIVLNVRSYE